MDSAQKLYGKTYRVKSGQLFRFEVLGHNGLRVISVGRPGTKDEIDEVNDFIRNELNASVYNGGTYGALSDKEGKQKEQDAYQEFLKAKKPTL